MLHGAQSGANLVLLEHTAFIFHHEVCVVKF